jgi:hypothetical protein
MRLTMLRVLTPIVGILALVPAAVLAQTEVRGAGVIIYSQGVPDGGNLFRHVEVNAWLDNNVAQGTISWQGDVFQPLPGGQGGFRDGGPSVPYILQVTSLSFIDANNAYVCGIVVASPEGVGNGAEYCFTFTDNGGTGQPDAIDGVPIAAGNIIVR